MKAKYLDDKILLPLVILHDVGYSQVNSDQYYKVDVRRAHMEAGAIIAEEILKKVGYDPQLIPQIVNDVERHDNWAFGEVDIYMQNLVLGVFKDLDYIWIASPQGFPAMKKVLEYETDLEVLELLIKESSPIGGQKPFSTITTRNLHIRYVHDRYKEIMHYLSVNFSTVCGRLESLPNGKINI